MSKIGRPTRFGDKQKIKLLVKENPRRKETAAHKNFKLFKNNMTIAKYVRLGGNMRDLRYSVDKGWIEIVDS